MVFALLVLAVAVFALWPSKAEAAPPPPPPSDAKPEGGFTLDGGTIGKLAGTVGGLGATLLGGGGAAAAGGTGTAAGTTTAATGGSGATAASTTGATAGSTSGGAAGGSTAATETTVLAAGEIAEGLTLGGAFAVTGFFVGIYLVIAISIMVGERRAQDILQSQWWSKKRERLFEELWAAEELALERMLQWYADQTSTPAVFSQAQLPTPYVDAADGGAYAPKGTSGGYYVSRVDDPRISLQQLIDVRMVARWFAVQQAFYRQMAVASFWGTLGVPLPEARTVDVDGYTVVGVYSESPAYKLSDFWRMVDNYCFQQPFAKPVPASGASVESSIIRGISINTSPLTLQNSTVAQFTSLQVPGYLPQFPSFAHVDAHARSKLGAAAANEMLARAQLMGFARAATLAGVKGYSFGWPGDREFTEEIGRRCGIPYPAENVLTAAGEPRPVLREQTYGYAIDVVRSRELGGPVVYSNRELQ